MKRGPQPTPSSDHLHGFFFFPFIFCMFPSAENLIVALRDRRDFAVERKRTNTRARQTRRALKRGPELANSLAWELMVTLPSLIPRGV